MFRAIQFGSLVLLAVLIGCEVTTVYETPPDEPTEAASATEPVPTESPSQPVASEPARQPPAVTHVTRGRLQFVQGYAEGYHQARHQGRPMFIYFTAPWCQFCESMAIETFSDAQVVQLAEQFTCVLVDADVEPRVCQQFQVSGYPTVQFVSPTGTVLNRVTGKRAAPQFALEMRAALRAVARRSGTGLNRPF
jgi:thiol-disulfide isomerase/thioredoxin